MRVLWEFYEFLIYVMGALQGPVQVGILFSPQFAACTLEFFPVDESVFPLRRQVGPLAAFEMVCLGDAILCAEWQFRIPGLLGVPGWDVWACPT